MSTPVTESASPATHGAGLTLVLPGKSAAAGEGITWISQGWRLFTKAPLMWIVAILILFVLAIVVNLVPLIGGLVFQLLNPVFAAGFVVACRSLEQGGEFELEHLFAGFKTNLANLVIVGLICMVGWIVILVVVAGVTGFGIIVAVMSGDTENMLPAIMGSGMSILIGVLVMLALMVPLLMAYWFAPALVIMHNLGPGAALKESFMGCLRNILPFLLYGIVMTVLAVIAVIPFGLGMLVWVPLAIASTYAAYREIFTAEPL
jgi:uncharacterized membrane protein